MPQLDVETFPSLFFWLILSFGALYLGLNYFVIPKITKILESREEKIEGYLDKAQKFQKKSFEIQKVNEEKLHEAHLEAQNLFSDHSKEMRDLYRRKEEELSQSFHKQYLKFEEDLTLKHQETSKTLAADVSEFIYAFLSKVTNKQLSKEEIQKEILEMKKDKK